MLKTTIQEMNRLTPQEYQLAAKIPLIVVLDNIRSQHNIGAVFRTADAFCLESVWLCGICSCPPSDEIHKTALGAEQTVDWRYIANTQDAVNTLHLMGYKVYAVEQAHGSTLLQDMALDPQTPTAIIFGHEVFGVQQSVVDMSDGCIEIPQYGTKHSLNVSVTAGIVMYQLSCQLRR